MPLGSGLMNPRADCSDCSYTTIRSLIVDGNRPLLLRVLNGGALIETGNGEGQSVRDCRLYEPRSVILNLSGRTDKLTRSEGGVLYISERAIGSSAAKATLPIMR